jgi:hypothetical protein
MYILSERFDSLSYGIEHQVKDPSPHFVILVNLDLLQVAVMGGKQCFLKLRLKFFVLN